MNILSLGAGVQSSTMHIMAQLGELNPMPRASIFADTLDEPASVYLWLEWLDETFKEFPIIRVHNNSQKSLSENSLTMNLTKDNRLFSKADIPFYTLNNDGSKGKITHRACTRDFKIYPIIQSAREIVGRAALLEWRQKHKIAIKELNLAKNEKRPCANWAWREMQEDALVIQWIGISIDEASRMKESRTPWIKHRWPLIEAHERWDTALHNLRSQQNYETRRLEYGEDNQNLRPTEFIGFKLLDLF